MSNVTIGPTGTGALPAYSGSVDAANDLIPIYQNSNAGTYSINRNSFLALASAPVGLNDTQTLTNKTLTSPTISGPTLSGTIGGTYTLGGTPTFPSSVATLSGTQTLTNKTLTSPTINSPNITNATITADTISGYTTSNSGTIYGISVSSGAISSSSALGSNIVTNSAIASGALYSSKVYNPYKFNVYLSGSQTLTTSFTTIQFNTVTFDTSSNFNTSSHEFIAPIAGFYFLSASVSVSTSSSANYFNIQLYKNGTTIILQYLSATTTSSGNFAIPLSGIFALNANDYVQVQAQAGTGFTTNTGASACIFSGNLVSAT